VSKDLTPEKALIFRIVHRDNVPWILDHGLHCKNSSVLDPNYVEIGNPDLIGRRDGHRVKLPPSGTLSNYISFYFTPFSPMLFNIKTGWGGIRKRDNDEIVIMVSSLPIRRRRSAIRQKLLFISISPSTLFRVSSATMTRCSSRWTPHWRNGNRP